MLKKILKTLLLILWLTLIYFFSSQNGTISSNTSGRLLVLIGNFFKVNDINAFVSTFSFLIRKTAHFTEYFILFLISLNCFKEYRTSNKIALIALIFCILCASFDEFHQLFVDGRSGQVKDVLIDSCGSGFSFLLWHLFEKWKKDKCQEKRL